MDESPLQGTAAATQIQEQVQLGQNCIQLTGKSGWKCRAQRPPPPLLRGNVRREEHSSSGPDASRHTPSDEYDNCFAQWTARPT